MLVSGCNRTEAERAKAAHGPQRINLFAENGAAKLESVTVRGTDSIWQQKIRWKKGIYNFRVVSLNFEKKADPCSES